MPQESAYKIATELELIPEQTKKAYPIVVKDWIFIKDRVIHLKENVSIYSTLGSAFLGAGFAGILSLLSGEYSSPSKHVICIAFVIVAIILGVAGLFFGKKQQDLQRDRAHDISDFMDSIEGRFSV